MLKEDMKGSHLFWSGHAVRRCVEYTVDSFTHFIEGRIVSDVTLREKGKELFYGNLEDLYLK